MLTNLFTHTRARLYTRACARINIIIIYIIIIYKIYNYYKYIITIKNLLKTIIKKNLYQENSKELAYFVNSKSA